MSSSAEQNENAEQRQASSVQPRNQVALAAVTLPANNPNPAPVPAVSQPPQPRNLQDLLRYSVEARNLGENANAVPNVGPMDEEVCGNN